jgi:hypothetical protein
MRIYNILLSILAFVLLLNMASATVTDVIITPKNPVVGDVISIKARTDQSSEPISITFEKKVPVKNEKYSFEISSVNIPMESCFVATANDVKTLNAKITWLIVPYTISVNSDSNGIARISQCHVPALSYNIKINGDAKKKSDVSLQFLASSTLQANKGKISYTYDSGGMPPGDYVVKIGGVATKIVLKEMKDKTKVAEVQETSDTGITGNENSEITIGNNQETVSKEKKEKITSEETPATTETAEPQRTDEKPNSLQTWKDSFFERILPIFKFW